MSGQITATPYLLTLGPRLRVAVWALLVAVTPIARGEELPANQWIELARDPARGRRGSAIRYAPAAARFFLWGFMNADANLLQENDVTEEHRVLAVRAAASLSSDYERKRVLTAALAKTPVRSDMVFAALDALETMKSGYERSQVLTAIAKGGGVTPQTSSRFMGAVSATTSSYEQGRVLAAVAATPALPESVAVDAVKAAATIDSAHDKRQAVAAYVRFHQERWDGSGYPHGLAGERIPLQSRIVAVCEAWASMVIGRPHAPARTPEHAVEELRKAAGSQFDPAVIEVVVSVSRTMPRPMPRVVSE